MINLEVNDSPLISLITVTLNAEKDIARCIQNVANQSYSNIEHLIIDGLSTDNTIEIVKEYAQKYPHIRYISEKDSGVYDAMNKGIDLAKGEWIYFLGADDLLAADNVLEKIFSNKQFLNIDFLVGSVLILSTKLYINYAKVKFDTWFCLTESVNHQALITNKDTFRKVGKFDTSYKLSADNRFFYEALKQGATYQYTDTDIAHFAGTGLSSAVKYRTIALQEKIRIIAKIYEDTKVEDRYMLMPYVEKYIKIECLPTILAYAISISTIRELFAKIDGNYPKLIDKALTDSHFLNEHSSAIGGYDNLNFGSLKVGLLQIWTVCRQDKRYFYHLKNTLYWLIQRMKRKS